MQKRHIEEGKRVLLERKRGFYERCIKRLIDVVCSLAAIIVFGWLYIIVAVLVRIKLGDRTSVG